MNDCVHISTAVLDFSRRLVTGEIDRDYVSATRPVAGAFDFNFILKTGHKKRCQFVCQFVAK